MVWFMTKRLLLILVRQVCLRHGAVCLPNEIMGGIAMGQRGSDAIAFPSYSLFRSVRGVPAVHYIVTYRAKGGWNESHAAAL
jgi:hypothetical protein